MCGREFEPGGTRDKYCLDCRETAYAARARELNLRRREEMGEVENERKIYFCDPPENIEKCLACTIPPDKCHGTCFMPGRKVGTR